MGDWSERDFQAIAYKALKSVQGAQQALKVCSSYVQKLAKAQVHHNTLSTPFVWVLFRWSGGHGAAASCEVTA